MNTTEKIKDFAKKHKIEIGLAALIVLGVVVDYKMQTSSSARYEKEVGKALENLAKKVPNNLTLAIRAYEHSIESLYAFDNLAGVTNKQIADLFLSSDAPRNIQAVMVIAKK